VVDERQLAASLETPGERPTAEYAVPAAPGEPSVVDERQLAESLRMQQLISQIEELMLRIEAIAQPDAQTSAGLRLRYQAADWSWGEANLPFFDVGGEGQQVMLALFRRLRSIHAADQIEKTRLINELAALRQRYDVMKVLSAAYEQARRITFLPSMVSVATNTDNTDNTAPGPTVASVAVATDAPELHPPATRDAACQAGGSGSRAARKQTSIQAAANPPGGQHTAYRAEQRLKGNQAAFPARKPAATDSSAVGSKPSNEAGKP
jgi:hypothetical protein